MATLSDSAGRASTSQGNAGGLRVALFSGNYNYVREGANQALNKLVGHLLARGADVRVYSPTTDTPAFEPAGELVSVPSIALPHRSEFRVALGLPRSIRSNVRQFRPHIVHLSTPDWLGTSAQRFARELGAPVVASMHTRFETYFDYYGLGALRSWAWRRQRDFYQACDRVLVPNQASLGHISAMGIPAERLRIWSRGVDRDRFSPDQRDMAWRRAHGITDDDLALLFFGRIVREKGTAIFAETVELLGARGVKLRPVIVGEGPARDEFADQLGDAVFTGHLDGQALGRAVASADILLNPSVTETFGNVYLEAMASGVCAVSADTPNAAELIDHGVNGYLCPLEPRAFADTIQMLSERPEARLAAGARGVATAANYRWPEILDSVLGVYRELVPPPK